MSVAQLGTLRLVLAIAVFAAHFVQIFLTSNNAAPFVSKFTGACAWYAVLGFFLISGRVIGASIIAKAQQNPDRLFLHFFARRIGRIYPPLVASVAITFLLGVAIDAAGKSVYVGFASLPARETYLYTLTQTWRSLFSFGLWDKGMSATNGPLWSLVLELRAYVIVGLAAQAIVARSSTMRLCAGLAFAIVAWILWVGTDHVDVIYYLAFAMGLTTSLFHITLPNLRFVPHIKTEFSYSLYIMHFPIMLAAFFIGYNAIDPGKSTLIAAALIGAALAFGISYISGCFLESRVLIDSIARILEALVQFVNVRLMMISNDVMVRLLQLPGR
jgi:peptidoglycan/LPS O-acetylase OafA/YrhL